jgi:DNA-binding XRE family transcriptional regulator
MVFIPIRKKQRHCTKSVEVKVAGWSGMAKTRSGAAITTPRKRRVTPREYRAAFAARVRQARTAARYPVDEMALLLGVTRDTYNKYEGRGASLMPHNLIVPFCLACRVSVEWLLTGIGHTKSR